MLSVLSEQVHTSITGRCKDAQNVNITEETKTNLRSGPMITNNLKRKETIMKRIFTLYFFALFCLISQAQEELYERVYVHTDKTCYLAGEEVWIKFYTTDTHIPTIFFQQSGIRRNIKCRTPAGPVKIST